MFEKSETKGKKGEVQQCAKFGTMSRTYEFVDQYLV